MVADVNDEVNEEEWVGDDRKEIVAVAVAVVHDDGEGTDDEELLEDMEGLDSNSCCCYC